MLEPDPDAARVVRRIFAMADAGTGMLRIARVLNEEGIASPAGNLCSKNGVHFILRNELYTGTQVLGVNALMRSRAPTRTHPRRVASTYLLSGPLECRECRRAFRREQAKCGQFAYYVCQSIMKHGRDACETPRLHARRFEEMVLERIRANVLTGGISPVLVGVVGGGD